MTIKQAHKPKIIAKWGATRLVQTSAPGIKPMMARIAHTDRKFVSSEYRRIHLELNHRWSDDDGSVSIDEILGYEGWNK